MTGKAIGLSLGFGFKGNFSRTPDDITPTKNVKATSANIPFGMPVVQNTDNTISSPSSVVLTTSNFGGFVLSIVKQMLTYPSTTDDTSGYYAPNDPASVLKRGCMVTELVHGTPTAGGQVYVRTVLNGAFPDEIVGDVRADADSSNTIAVPSCIFETGKLDANNMVEIRLTKQNI
jgi:hypothetical protein